jgi:ABC-type branched-subunit amino acid transport system ATPase component
LNNGRFIADGDPRTVIGSPAVVEVYIGMESDADLPG